MKPLWVVRHVPHEGLGTIADSLRDSNVPFVTIDAFAGPLPTFDPQALSGLIVMGGPMNVDEVDRYPFLAEELQWLQLAMESRLPVLGVCLGSQLLAKALGAKVYPNPIKEIGWYEVELLPTAADDPLFAGVYGQREASLAAKKVAVSSLTAVTTNPEPRTPNHEPQTEPRTLNPPFTVFQWHGDTFDLPIGAVQLARSRQCENQAFCFGASAYGLQFHLEVTQQIIDNWLCEASNCCELAGLDYINPSAIRRDTPDKLPPMTALGRTVFDRFVRLCRTDRSAGASRLNSNTPTTDPEP
jgi:GMP synthase (glutamine-hydrolysing)